MVILLNDETGGMKERMKQCIKSKKGRERHLNMRLKLDIEL